MGLFSGLTDVLKSGDFYAGAATKISDTWEKEKEEQSKILQKLVTKTFDDGKVLRDKKREKNKRTKEQYEAALMLFGSDPNAGAVADAMARLSPTQYETTVESIKSARATAEARGTGASLKDLGYITGTTGTADPSSGELVGVGLTEKFTGSSEDVVKRIMGTLENTNVGVDPKEKDTLKKSFLRRVGGLSTEDLSSEARRAAAEQLGISVEELSALRSGEGYTGMVGPVAGVNLGVTDPAAVREIEQAEVSVNLTKAQLEKAQAEAKAATLTLELGNKVQTFKDPIDNVDREMTGYEFQSRLEYATSLSIIAENNSKIAERLGKTNWSRGNLTAVRGSISDSAIRSLGLDSNLFSVSRDVNGNWTGITTKAVNDVTNTAVLTLANIYSDFLYNENTNATEQQIVDISSKAAVSGQDFLKKIIDLFDSEETSERSERVKNLIAQLDKGNTTGNPGTDLIAKFRENLADPVVTPESLPTEPAAAAAAAAAETEPAAAAAAETERAAAAAAETERAAAAETERAATGLMAPRADQQPPTEFRGTAVTDIKSALTDNYDLYETYTTPPNMTTRNEKVLSNFLYDNSVNMKYEREDITKMLKKYRVMQKKANDKQESEGVISRELQGVPVTPELIRTLVTANTKPYVSEAVVETRIEKREPLTALARGKAWNNETKDFSGRVIPKDQQTASPIQTAFLKYLVARGVSDRSKQRELWINYFNQNTEKAFTQTSVDNFLTSQDIE